MINANQFYQTIDTYYAESRFKELEAFLLQTLAETDSEDVEDINTRIMVLNELGTYYRGNTHFDQAIHYFRQAIALLAATSGSTSIEYATAVNNLGGAFRMSGQFDLARDCFTEMTLIYAQYMDKNPMLYASGINNLALLDLAQGKYESAIPSLEKALSIVSSIPSLEWEQATTMCNLGICLLHIGKSKQAEDFLLRAKNMILTMPNSRQGHLAAIQSALGTLYEQQGKTDEALTAYKTSRDLILKHYGKNRDYGAVCLSIAHLLYQKGELAEADAMQTEGESVRKVFSNS